MPEYPQQNISNTQPIQRMNWKLYVLTIILSIILLIFLNGSIILALNFIFITSFTMVYVFVSIISFILGLITALILKKITKSNKSVIIGCAVISLLSATISAIFISLQNLASQITEWSNNGPIGLVALFGELPSPYVIPLLILIFFNLLPTYLLIKNNKVK
jgi:hypothetical protein